MAEPVVIPQGATPSPEPKSASQFALITSPVEILLIIGRGRAVMAQAPQMAVEWIGTYSVSPVAAKQLVKGLTAALAEYEKQTNSKIPEVLTDAEKAAKK